MRYPVALVLSLILASLLPTLNVSALREYNNYDKNPKHFVLVHGGCLGAWSWYKIIPLLKLYGHNVTAIDLAGSGINPLQSNQVQSYSDYAKPLLDFMESLSSTERVILVGHSYGGGAISMAMELFPEKVSVGVFVTALMPGPSLPFPVIAQEVLAKLASLLDNKLSFDDGPKNPPTFIFGPTYTSQVLFQYSPPQDATLANLLIRPVHVKGLEDVVLTEEKYGSVKRVCIISEEDRILTKEFQVSMIQKNPPNKVESILNSDHMVMASQPTELTARLLGIAQNFSQSACSN